jgi:anti-sigma regulatory factor (Ser/Thr protein kinase)
VTGVTFALELPRELDSAAAARHAVDQLSDRLPEDQLGDVRLLVSELVTNSLRHAELGAEDQIGLAVEVDELRIRVEVTDPGKGFEVVAPADDPDTVEGWGLYLVSTLSDRWGVDTNDAGLGSTVWFELDRAPETGLAAA